MATYHLYYLRQGMLVGASDIEAADDEDACRLAGQTDGGDLVEVWDSSRRIRILAAARTGHRAGGPALTRAGA